MLVRIQVPAGRQLQFFDDEGRPLAVPASVHLTREIELPAGSRVEPESSAAVVANRVGVTSALFGIAVGAAVLLGRSKS